MKRKNILMWIILMTFVPLFSQAQKAIPLYPDKIPNSRNAPNQEYSNADHTIVYKVSRPELYIYLPSKEKATGTAVIICPGGGYHALMMDWEGFDIAKRFVKMGIAAFVLKYRLPSDVTMINKTIGPLQDAQQAIKVVRKNALKWHIDSNKIGIMGFSAGGHLASTASTHFEHAVIHDEGISLRPDFMILVYPVISMTDSIGHIGSRNHLLGKNPSLQQINYFSNEKQVKKHTPPTFLVQAEEDKVVSVQNSLSFYEALRKKNVPVALHIYEKGGHGFLKFPPRDLWMREVKYWLKINKF